MQYGYFDSKNKEYVITRPDTPAPWANYLGSPEYGAIISNNAGGYSFVKSGANGRIIRYRFNYNDRPGRYIYLHDHDDKDYWSASWQPVAKPLDLYQSTCHHGTAYTEIISQYKGIETASLYYVPLGKTYEVWRLKVTNNSPNVRKIGVTGFVEFTSESNYEQDQVNLQYTQYITRTHYEKNKIIQHINENVGKNENGTNFKERFFGVVGGEVSSYCGDLSGFFGPYREYSNPISIEEGQLNNGLNYNTNSCGALQVNIELAPSETKELVYLLGAYNAVDGQEIMDGYSYSDIIDTELAELKGYWHSKLENLVIDTPDENLNHMVNVWNAYQCFITFTWSRAASFQYCGLRNGFGYRDTVQDIQGIIHLAPEMAVEKIRFMLSAQVHHGGGLPLVKFDHNAGHENTPEDPQYAVQTGHPHYRADDALWLFPTIEKYINETGDQSFLDEVIVYADKGEATVYQHLIMAIDFSMNRLGANGMPAGLHADWNDCLRMGPQGESTFVALQLYLAMNILKKYALLKNDQPIADQMDQLQEQMGKNIQDKCWEGDRYIRGIREDGTIVGSKNDPEASMWLNPQTWGVISGLATKEQIEKSMDNVYNQLNTPYGAMIMYPPYADHAFDGALMLLFNPSTKENGGIFSQTQGWLILAESMAGNGNRALEYFKEFNPAQMNTAAEKRVIEPYIHGQFTESKLSPFEGRSHVHWLTGTASTVMVGCVEGILGIQPSLSGITINPCIPEVWNGFTMTKRFRGKTLNIQIDNSNHVEKGIKEVILNGESLNGSEIPFNQLKDENEVTVIMG